MIDGETAEECEKRGIESFAGEAGKVYVSKESMPRKKDATLIFDLQNFIGIKSPYVRIV